MGVSLTDGFDQYYRPGPEREKRAFDEGLIVLDANVLLHVLRYSPTAREELLGVIEVVADRCLIPHQVALEYNRNRVRVVEDRRKELASTTAEIDSIRSRARAVVNSLRERRTLGLEEVHQLDAAVSEFFAALETASADAADQYDLNPDDLVGRKDALTSRLELALTEKVADAPSADLRAEDEKEAERRREAGLAPGFKDKAGGDYLWWAEVMRSDLLQGKPLVIVSDDAAKGDWRYEVRGMTAGPHSLLTEDVLRAGGTDLVLLTTRDLLRLAEQTGASPVSDETIAESEKVLADRRPPWTLFGYIELVRALERDGYHSRVEVIRGAAQQGGLLPRMQVYRFIGATEDERSLRQFATPVQRLTTGLVEAAILSPRVGPALWAEYDGPGKATGYSVPTEFCEFESVLGEALRIVSSLAVTDWDQREQVSAQMRSSIRRLALSHESVQEAAEVADSIFDWASGEQAVTANFGVSGERPTAPAPGTQEIRSDVGPDR